MACSLCNNILTLLCSSLNFSFSFTLCFSICNSSASDCNAALLNLLLSNCFISIFNLSAISLSLICSPSACIKFCISP
uniref:Uncharacterized protein n=1 Tax=Panstrongylus lignarius TaxID=156445 RepID=A0A224XT44_9HEMI